MATRTNTISSVRKKLQITGTNELLTDAEVGNSVDEAVLKYSKDKPKNAISQFLGKNQYDYDVSYYLSSWVDDFSVISKIETPQSGQTSILVEDEDYELYKPDTTIFSIDAATSGATSITLGTASNAYYFLDDMNIYIYDDDANESNWVNGNANTSTGVITLDNAIVNTYDANQKIKRRDVLRFKSITPGTSDIIKVNYTTTHTLSDSSDTIPSIDLNAVEDLASAISCEKIAAELAKHEDSTLSADTIDHLDKSREWQKIADRYYKTYQNHLGIKDGNKIAAMITKDNDLNYAWGEDRLFHKRKWR